MKAHSIIAKKYNVSLGMYESGSSMVEYNAMMTGKETPGATDKYIAMNRDSRMYQVYKDYYTMYAKYNLTENCHFCYVALPTKYGSWELLDTQDQSIETGHRYRAMLDLINQTRGPVKNYTDLTCFGILYNSSNVCSKKGVCIAQDNCMPLNAPTSSSELTFYPPQGVSLADNFYIQTRPWTANFPLLYAFGIVLPNNTLKVLTSYSNTPSTVTILPYTGQPYQVCVFVKDPLGNVYTAVTSQTVSIIAYNGTLASFNALSANFTQLQKNIVSLDKSPELNAQILNSINLLGSNVLASLTNLEQISASFTGKKQIISTLQAKVESFLATLAASDNSSQALTVTETQSMINVISNIQSTVGSTSSKNMIDHIALMLVKSGSNDTLDANATSLPAVFFSSPTFSISVSSFNPSNFNQNKYISQSALSADLSEIFSSKTNSKASVTLIKYAADTSLSPVAFSKVEIKFFSANSLLSVSGLNKPIILKFPFNIASSSSMKKSTVSCKYYNEASGTWNIDGCKLSSIDYVNGYVYCACTHTTLFSVASDTNSVVISSDESSLTLGKSAGRYNSSIHLIYLILLVVMFKETINWIYFI